MKKSIAVCIITGFMMLWGSMACLAEDVILEEIILDEIILDEQANINVIEEVLVEEVLEPEEMEPVFAGITIDEGWAGENATWILDEAGVLTISGRGEISCGVFDNLKDQIKYLNIEEGITSIAGGVFQFYENLEAVTFPDSVTKIGNSAFSGCTSLAEVIVPGNTGPYAFHGCTNLRTVTIVNGAESIGEFAFGKCSSLKKLTIEDGVVCIGRQAFYECTSLTDVSIADSVTEIGDNAFWCCTSLEKIKLPNSMLTTGDGGVFSDCISLKDVYIPNSVTSISIFTFSGCTGLKKITIPDSVTVIGENAFNGCTSLEEVTIPDSVRDLRYLTFQNCTSLREITIPDSLESINDSIFKGCTGLTSLTVPAEVVLGGDWTGGAELKNCPNLTIYGYYGSPAEKYANWNQIPFVDIGEHIFDSGKVMKVPTCTEEGIRLYTCTHCQITKTEEIPAVGHRVVIDKAVAATCKKTGLTAGSHCSVCGKIIKAQIKIPAAHKVTKWKTTAPTVLKAGKKTGKCSLCKKTVTVTISKLKPTIKLSATNVKLKKKKSMTIKVSGLAKGDGVKTWSSSNKKVATVTSKGKITAKGIGSATVTVKLKSGKAAAVRVVVI